MDYTYRDFSKIANMTIRTLRYYESLGLIEPLIKQQVKYLKEEELMKMQTIDLLQKAGYTLQEIKEILENKNVEEQLIMQQDLLNLQLINTKTMLALIEELKKTKDMDIKEMYQKFKRIQNTNHLQLQFESAEGLQKRVRFHHMHTHFKDNFHQWMFQHYHFPAQAKVLEIGCGDGTIWDCNREWIPSDSTIILSDVSLNMLKESKQKLSDIKQIKSYEEIDCFHIPYDDQSFDVVIANHVFMYFEDLTLALKEVHRVLKENGTLYCSTIAKDMMQERDLLLKEFDKRISFDQALLYQRFGYENGEKKLAQYFQDIQLFDRKELYEIKNLDMYFAFILSAKGLSLNLEPLYHKQEQFYAFMKTYYERHKKFDLTTHAGMFSARKKKVL